MSAVSGEITAEELEEVAEAATKSSAKGVRYDFDSGFQSKICAMCLRDTPFIQRTDGLIEPDYFESEIEAALVNIANRYYKRYKKAPSDEETLKLLIAKDMKDRVIRKELGPLMFTHARNVLLKSDISDRDLVIDEVSEFARHQAVCKAIEASIGHLDKRNFTDIQKLLQSALNVGSNSEHGIYSYADEIDSRTEERTERAAGRGPLTGVSTGYVELDSYLYHKGWGKGELSVLMGGPKAGKSLALINFGINAAASIMRFNVLYVTLELGAKIIADRMDANISKQMMFELGKNITEVQEHVRKWRASAGHFHIIEFPTGSMKVSDLRRIIERKKAEGIKYDLVIVDYADLMSPERHVDDAIENSKSVYVALRGLAMQEHIALLTATQTNREGAKSAVAKMEHVSSDINKVRIADALISINKTEEEAANNEARLYFAAMRNGPSNFSLRIRQNIDRMSFCETIIGVC